MQPARDRNPSKIGGDAPRIILIMCLFYKRLRSYLYPRYRSPMRTQYN
uniref:Uncharacterized protein n=1 Tax=Arundo donax TaxID=35708 RepID=A0A0A9EQK2_ARUDO